MFFKWWKKYPTPKSVAQAVDSFWWEFNAYTWDEYAWYYVKSAPEFLHQATDVLGDMMIHPQFPKEELEREKWVVIQEIKMYEDNPQRLVIDKRQEYFFWDNSYGRSTLWPESNIKSFNQDMLFQHKNSLYTKDNIVITVAWNILNPEQLEQQIWEIFSHLPENKSFEKPNFSRNLPSEQRSHYDKKTEQNHLIISSKWMAWTDEEKYQASILSTILWGNMSSRLFQNIREKQWLCYYIWARHYTSYDHGVFMIRAGIDKERFDYGLERIFYEIENIASWEISNEEFQDAIWNSIWKLQMWIEWSDDIASFFWMQQLIYWEIKTIDQQLEKIKTITKDQVQAMAEKLKKDNLYLYYIK